MYAVEALGWSQWDLGIWDYLLSGFEQGLWCGLRPGSTRREGLFEGKVLFWLRILAIQPRPEPNLIRPIIHLYHLSHLYHYVPSPSVLGRELRGLC
jgi:hypothetical protein